MMTAWFKRARQTRTPVQGMQSEAKSRKHGIYAAYRTLGAIEITAQLLLWITLFCYDQTAHASWQAVVLLLVPTALLWALWQAGRRGIHARAGAFAGLVLVPCLVLDAAFLINTLTALMIELIPSYSRPLHVLLSAGLCFLTVCVSRENGVAYGAGKMGIWFLGLFLLGSVFLSADANPGRLWPIWGQGIGKTAVTALSGMGSVWGVALLFFLPLENNRSLQKAARGIRIRDRKTLLGWTLLPWVLGLVWALWFGMTHPWRSGDALSIGERLVGMARHSTSILLCELNNVMWLLLLIFSLAGAAMSGEKLVRNAAPKIPRSAASAAVLLPGTLCTLIWPEWLFDALTVALPYRVALSAAAALAMIVIAKKEARA